MTTHDLRGFSVNQMMACLTPEAFSAIENHNSPVAETFLLNVHTYSGDVFKMTGEQFLTVRNFLRTVKEPVKEPVHSQESYEKAYWDYVRCGTEDVLEPARLLAEMTNKITSLNITHVIDKKPKSSSGFWALATFLPTVILLVLTLTGVI